MHKLALALLLCAGCVETTSGRDATPTAGHILPGNAADSTPAAAAKHETRTPVVRDYEPHAFPTSHHEPVMCGHCR